jgi:hypothetical protein
MSSIASSTTVARPAWFFQSSHEDAVKLLMAEHETLAGITRNFSADQVNLGGQSVNLRLEQDVLRATAALPKNVSFESIFSAALNMNIPTTISNTTGQYECTPTTDSLTTVSGLRVDVTLASRNSGEPASVALTRAGGKSVTFEAVDNIRINEREDGTLAVTFAETGETRIYATDGTVTTEQGEAGNLSGTDGNDVFLQLRAGSRIDAGAGDDAIFILAGDSIADGGDGNDLLVLGGAVGNIRNTIYGGGGNDTLLGGSISATVDMGEGDNEVTVGTFNAGNLTAGNGKNVINADRMLASAVTLGDGNNKINVGSATGSTVVLGNGDNVVTANSSTNGSLVLGDGDNVVTVRSFNTGTLTTGDGKNTVNAISMNGSYATLGDGDNVVNVGTIWGGYSYITGTLTPGSGAVTMGNGNNTVRWSNIGDRGQIIAGNGNNTLMGDMMCGAGARISTGDGDNIIELSISGAIYDSSKQSIALGDGNNTLVLGYGAYVDVSAGTGHTEIVGDVGRRSVEAKAGGTISYITGMQYGPAVIQQPERVAQSYAKLYENDQFMREWEQRVFG